MEEKSKDHEASKLERLLSTHSLEGLVYEKRERKQAPNPFSHIYSQAIIRKKVTKPPPKTKDKKQVKIIKKQSKLKSKEKQDKAKKQIRETNLKNSGIKNNQKSEQPAKKRGRPRKQKRSGPKSVNNKEKQKSDKKYQAEVRIKQEDESQQQANEQSENNQMNQPQQKVGNIKKQEQDESQYQSENVPNKKPQVIQKIENQAPKKQKLAGERVGFKKFKKVESSEHKQKSKRIKNGQKSQESNKNGASQQQEEEKVKQRQPQVHKITRVHSVSELIDSFNDQQRELKTDKPINEKEINMEESEEDQQSNELPKKRVLRIRRNNISHEQPKLIQENECLQSESSSKKRRPRLRKRKEDALKKFSLLEDGSEYEDNQNYEVKRRRGVLDKQYQINRIFRKTQKANLPNVKLEVDITKFSLQNFAEKFKDFDMIHCSLPLDMLIRLPNISSLISKGFIFIWAQKGQIQIGYHWLNRLGFDVIDQIVWTKTNKNLNEMKCDKNIENEIFPNCRSTCLVGYKCSSTQKTQYCTKISNNLIFEAQYNSTLQKPDHIYQIGDLLMPGAKKLEIGYKEMGGWFTLKHVEESMVRCHQCFRRDSYKMFTTTQLSVVCQYCLDFNKRKATEEEEEQKKVQPIEQNDNDIKLYPLQYIYLKFDEYLTLKCQNCNQKVLQLLKITNLGDIHIEHKASCKKCFTLPDQACSITVTKIQQVYFPSKSIQCSKCNKNRLYKYYFECFSCKQDHVQCSSCFMKPAVEQDGNEDEKSHDWKLKVINQFPETRALCFTCNDECSIPYWACQICQNWYWCGKCDHTIIPKAHQHHCHYFTQHELHLII